MKKYSVNVHYDVCVSTYVEAECEDDVLVMAENMAEYALNVDVDGDDCELVYAECVAKCIEDEEDIDEDNEI